MDSNMIHRPKHYSKNGVTPLECFMNGLLSKEQTNGFIIGNCIKYLIRFESKGGEEDLYKAREYLDLLIDFNYVEE